MVARGDEPFEPGTSPALAGAIAFSPFKSPPIHTPTAFGNRRENPGARPRGGGFRHSGIPRDDGHPPPPAPAA